MKRISQIVLLIFLTFEVLNAGRPVTIIRCVDRSDSTTPAELKGDNLLKALDPGAATEHFCYPGLITFNISNFDCTDPSIASEIITVRIMGDTLIVGDALTIDSITNAMFTDGSSALADDFDPATDASLDERIAVVSISAGVIEIEFTRDPFSETIIKFRNAQTADGSGKLIIPACDPAMVRTIPTLGQWSLIILGMLFLIFGVVVSRQSTFQSIPSTI